MNTKNRRKQNLSTRLVEESTMTSVCDPFLSAGPDKESYFCEESLISPSEWNIEQSDSSVLPNDRSGASSLDMPTSDLYAEELVDMNALLDFDFNDPDKIFLEEDPAQENQDIFQDIRYTSTPKSRPIESSTSHAEPAKKRPHYVLHDITDTINYTNNESFIHINQVLDTTPPLQIQQTNTVIDSHKFITPDLHTPPPTIVKRYEKQSPSQVCRTSGRKVGIIRKRLPLRTPQILTSDLTPISIPSSSSKNNEQISLSQQSSSKSSHKKNKEKEQITYYFGINNYELGLALIKFIRIPPCKELSSFQMQQLTFMKIRLDLQWKDMAFRFECSESVIKRAFIQTLGTFSECLIELLPWHLNKRNIRKNPKTYFVHTIQRNESQVLLIIGDGRKPINYVSQDYPKEEDPISIILNECGNNLVKGDEFNINDSIYKIDLNGASWGVYQENRSRLPGQGRDVVKKMTQDFPVISSDSIVDFHKVMIVIAAITNINFTNTISNSVLKVMYEKSADVVFQNYS